MAGGEGARCHRARRQPSALQAPALALGRGWQVPGPCTAPHTALLPGLAGRSRRSLCHRTWRLLSNTRHQLLLNTHSFPQAQYFSSHFSYHRFLLSLVHILVLTKPKRNEANRSKPKADSRMSEFQKQHTVFTHFYFPRPLTQYNSIPLSQLTCSRPHRNKHRAQVNLQTTH